MKRSLSFAALILLVAAVALAAARPLYRINLRNGDHLLSRDQPMQRGSVVLFHAYPSGKLTGLPAEAVATVTSATTVISADQTTVMAPRTLEPGEVVYLGPTGGQGKAPAVVPVPASSQIPGGVYDPRNPLYGGYAAPRAGTGPPGTAVAPGTPVVPGTPGSVVPGTPGDLARALSGPAPTPETLVSPNGFPVTGAPSPPIGPNGEPILAPAGAPGSTPPTIGPNGTPVLAPPGGPGSVPPPVGPNGYPVPPGR